MATQAGDQQVPRTDEVFISYSRKDKEFVRRLDEELKRRDREAWVDWEGIPPGDTWEKTIYGAIEASHTFIFVLTPDSIGSEVCGKEIAHAAANNKRLVPIVHRDVAVDRVPKSLEELNWIFFRDSDDFEEATGKLISALDTDLSWVRAHTRLLTRAIEWDTNGRNNSFVLRGDDLRSAERWLAEAGAQKERQPTALQTEYIIASRKAAARRQRIALGAVALGAVVAIILAVVAFIQRGDARKQEVKAKTTSVQADSDLAVLYQKQSDSVDPRTLAHLARALRTQPNARLPRQYLVSLLRDSPWFLAQMEPMRHEDIVKAASFSSNGRPIVVTASFDKTARVWDAESGKPVGEPMRHESFVYAASFSPDGRRIVTSSYDKTARVWDTDSGKSVGEPMRHESAVHAASFSPDGRRIVTASHDKTARVWDGESGKPVGESMRHGDVVLAASFSPDGRRIVTGSEDKTARVWDAESGKPVGEPMRHESAVNAASFSPDGRRIVTGSEDNTTRVWDAASGKPVGESLRHEESVLAASFSPDGRRIVTASYDKTARVWDAESGKPVGEPMRHEESVWAASFSPDGRRIVTGSFNTARVWDAKSAKPVGEPMRHGDVVLAASFSPDGRRIVTGCWDKTARVWDAASGKPVGEPMRHEESVHAASFSPDGRRIVTASYDKTARVWDAESGKPVGEPMRHEAGINAASFSPDGRRIVTGSIDQTARVWNAESGKPVGEPMRHEGESMRGAVTAASFSPDGRRIVTGSIDKTVRVWDADSGKPVGEPMHHEDVVNAASFSPDGRWIVTASADKTARVWDVAVDLETPLPEWVPELAEALGQLRFNEEGLLVSPKKSVGELGRELLTLKGDDFWSRLGRWFFMRGPQRTISPDSKITVGEFTRQQFQETTQAKPTKQ